jgi:hypothetical protein
MSTGLHDRSPRICMWWEFQTFAHCNASSSIDAQNRKCISQMWNDNEGFKPSLCSKARNRLFHFALKPLVTSYQSRSIRVLCILLRGDVMNNLENGIADRLTCPRCMTLVRYPVFCSWRRQLKHSRRHGLHVYDSVFHVGHEPCGINRAQWRHDYYLQPVFQLQTERSHL